MLAKHLWRIMIHPERLLSRVLKARHFPTGDVFSATLGSRPSFTWRSIIAHDCSELVVDGEWARGLLFVSGVILGFPDHAPFGPSLAH
ncbi:putative mitochondrial protein [Sesamum angolense]|uniref:Mitochondrial protein n=1 Tax=Sesamum angolense TaxID=2727404 RepID=A0AAE1X5P3_9LAMI|nr:putative mitochondrial protein [Sesamum angolense]